MLLKKITNCELYVVTFIVTALWDVVLRIMSENYDKLPAILQLNIMIYLKPYFEKHTLLAAALIAGFVGVTTQPIILQLLPFPKDTNLLNMIIFMMVSFIISALYGFIMKWSRLFPILEDTYYKGLEKAGGVTRSMISDGISGLIVQITIVVLLLILKK